MAWKASTSTLPEEARALGRCWLDRGKRPIGPFPFCLPEVHAAHNLLADVRAEALERFRRHAIPWHMATPGPDGPLPSTHLLDSQVQCVNVLLSLARNGALLDLVRQVVPDAERLVEVEDGSPVAFEWIGGEDYLGEGRGRRRTRGAYVTSADALMVAEGPSGRTALVTEWKYTEHYPKPLPVLSARGTDRRKRYQPLYDTEHCVFTERPPLAAYFHEPHYQLLRLGLLAQEMVRVRELGVERAVLLHLFPGGNEALHACVPDGLLSLGERMSDVWHALLPGPTVTYRLSDTTSLVGSLPELHERYA